MTRANFNIIAGYGSIKLQIGSDGYLSGVIDEVKELVKSVASTNSFFKDGFGFYDNPSGDDLGKFISDLNLSIGHVGNFSYAYEIDFVKQKIKAWDSTIYWVNAPEDWEARGWNCWKGNNGKYGYTNWRKGKLIYDKTFLEIYNE